MLAELADKVRAVAHDILNPEAAKRAAERATLPTQSDRDAAVEALKQASRDLEAGYAEQARSEGRWPGWLAPLQRKYDQRAADVRRIDALLNKRRNLAPVEELDAVRRLKKKKTELIVRQKSLSDELATLEFHAGQMAKEFEALQATLATHEGHPQLLADREKMARKVRFNAEEIQRVRDEMDEAKSELEKATAKHEAAEAALIQ